MSFGPIAAMGWMAAGVISLAMVAVVVGLLRISRRIKSAGARWSLMIIAFAFAALASSWAVSRLAAALVVARGIIIVPTGSDLFVHLHPMTGLTPALIAASVGIWYLMRGRSSDRVA